MRTRNLVIVLAVVSAGLVWLIPSFLPTGPDTSVDFEGFLSSGRFFTAGALAFGIGLLTAFTPCVYPLIPITVSVFGAKQAEGRGKALVVTSSYVLGMAAVFSALGVVAAKTGQAFGQQLGDPRFVLALAALLLVLAASMFGAFEIRLPQALTQRLSSVGGAGVAGAFLMGSVSGFLAAPCTGPVLSSLLAFIAKSQSVALGASLMFVYALGIGFPFFLIGVFVVRLPRGGAWMEWVKSVLGILLVTLAALYVRDAFPQIRDMFQRLASEWGVGKAGAMAAALAGVGVLVGAFHRSFHDGASDKVLKALGVALVVSALVVRFSTLHANTSGAGGTFWHLTLPGTSSLTPFEDALADAKADGKPVMIDFFAEWCAACKELDRETYTSPQVTEEAGRFRKIKVDGTHETESIEALYSRFKIVGLPTVVFLSSRGELLEAPRVTGFLEADLFLAELKKVP